jgi:hypothetical protein
MTTLAGFPNRIQVTFGAAWTVASPYTENDVVVLTLAGSDDTWVFYTVTGEFALSVTNDFGVCLYCFARFKSASERNQEYCRLDQGRLWSNTE